MVPGFLADPGKHVARDEENRTGHKNMASVTLLRSPWLSQIVNAPRLWPARADESSLNLSSGLTPATNLHSRHRTLLEVNGCMSKRFCVQVDKVLDLLQLFITLLLYIVLCV